MLVQVIWKHLVEKLNLLNYLTVNKDPKIIVFPIVRRANEVEEYREKKRKMSGDSPLIGRASEHLSKNSAFPPDYDGNSPECA